MAMKARAIASLSRNERTEAPRNEGKLCSGAGRNDGPILLDCKINGNIAAPFLLESVDHERKK